MYYYSSRPKMSASAAGAVGVGAGGAGRLQNGSRCAGGGGCGELVNGDGRFNAVVATATTTTPTECCDTESRVAEAQPNSDWDKAVSPLCITAEPGSGKQKRNSSTESFFVNGITDSIITRERACACGQHGDSGGLGGGGCGAVGRQSDGPEEENGINIDHESEGSRHGGERRCFMDSASSRGERRVSKLQASVTGRRNCNVKGQTQTEEVASLSAAARCGHQNAESANSKRRGCSYTRASKRVCYAGTASAADCGRLGTGSETLQDSGGTPKSRSSSLSENSKDSQRHGSGHGDGNGGEKCQVGRTSAAGSHKSSPIVCPRVAGDSSNVNSNDMMAPCHTSKGRVRLYRVRSFLASTSGYHNGHGENGRCNFNGNSRSSPPPQDKAAQPGQHSSLVAEASDQRRNGGSYWGESSSQEAAVPVVSGANRTDADEAEDTQVKLEAQVERASGQASRRQTELEERSERALRRLQAVQVTQVERHVSQQLRGLSRRASRGSGDRKPAAAVLFQSSRRRELSRLAYSCSEVLSAAGGALDSDHTASSSGGSSESEEDDEDEGAGRRGCQMRAAKAVRRAAELQWAQERARLGSRWVWLQAQVSELEYRIRALTELYTHLRQGKVRTGPDTPLRAPRPPPPQNSATCRSSSVGEPLRKTKAEDAAANPQPPPASAARVCPLPRLRRHKLLRLEECPGLASKPVSMPCACEPPVVCMLCCGGPPRPLLDQAECVEQRRSRLDLCVHPVLTLPSDIPLAVQCGTSPLVGCSQNALRRTGVSIHVAGVGRRGQGAPRAGRGVRRRLVCPRPPNTLPPLQHTAGGSSGRTHRGVVSPGLLTQRITDLPPLSTTPPAPGSSNQPLRRRRGESSFDIDNLVMPMGLAGLGARVQKLQYKEIITPSWRELGDESEESPPPSLDSTHSHQQEQLQGETEPEEVEDMSDAAFLIRHATCESRERGRWRNWAHRRRRGRSSSYHGEGRWSSRGLEGSPTSPDFRQGHPTEGQSSPTSPFPFPDPEDTSFFLPEEELQVTLPWERRTFPLMEAELAALQEEEEEEEPCEGESSRRSQSTDSGISLGSLELSPRTPQPAAAALPPATLATATSSTQDSPCPPGLPLPTAFLPRPPLSPHTRLSQ